jgi:hypothetical protein
MQIESDETQAERKLSRLRLLIVGFAGKSAEGQPLKL